MKRISKRGIVRIITYSAAVLITLSALAVKNGCRAQKLEAERANSTLRSIGDLRTYMDNIGTTVLRGIYSSSGEALSAVAENLAMQTGTARYALSEIPESGELLSKTYTFLAQVSDFSTSLARKAGRGEAVSDEERETLYSFIDYAGGIKDELGILLGEIGSGEVSLDGMGENINSAVSTIDQNFSLYPTLVYDGPFSDHIMNKKPLLTAGQPEITSDTARTVAAAAYGTEESRVYLKAETEGKMPAYDFSVGDDYISVAKNGGYLIYMIKNAAPADVVISVDEALTAARNYVKKLTLENMEKSYYEISDGVCYVNFEYTENGITYYPDLVKVGVDMSTGDIISYDARGYIVNHCKRNLPDSTVSVSAAAEKLPRGVKYTSCRLAVIPVSGGSEQLCYEFACKGMREEDILVYLDAATGREVSVLILLVSENGTVSR